MGNSIKIHLKSVLLLENGQNIKKNGNTLFSVVLSHPRPGVSAVEKIIKIPFNGKSKKPLTANQLYSTETVEPAEKLLLWERFNNHDEMGISVTISATESASKETEIIKKIAIAAGTTILGSLTGGIVVAVGAAIGTTLLEAAFGTPKKEAEVAVLGKATIYFPQFPSNGDLIFHLTTTKEIKYSLGVSEKNGILVESIATIPKGYGIAKVTLSIEQAFLVTENPIDMASTT